MTQVTISMVMAGGQPTEEPEVKIGVLGLDSKGGPVGEKVMLSAGNEKKQDFTVPDGGKLEVTAELPPLVYDTEQKASVPGEWPPEEATEPEPSAKVEAAPAKATTSAPKSDAAGAASTRTSTGL